MCGICACLSDLVALAVAELPTRAVLLGERVNRKLGWLVALGGWAPVGSCWSDVVEAAAGLSDP
jgi:hypothetical protein